MSPDGDDALEHDLIELTPDDQAWLARAEAFAAAFDDTWFLELDLDEGPAPLTYVAEDLTDREQTLAPGVTAAPVATTATGDHVLLLSWTDDGIARTGVAEVRRDDAPEWFAVDLPAYVRWLATSSAELLQDEGSNDDEAALAAAREAMPDLFVPASSALKEAAERTLPPISTIVRDARFDGPAIS